MEKINRHRKSLNYALQAIKSSSYFDRIDKIILFGSCARSDYTYDSDVDLMIVSDRLEPEEMRKLRILANPPDWEIPEVDLQFGTSKGFSFSKCFENNIKSEGKVLWERT